ncbi:MAG TPA: hypothetical protein DCG47_06910, partial [Spirochaetaceae bacterium]|nr:hypothetical protein [Spirochaetaceae bacterium]
AYRAAIGAGRKGDAELYLFAGLLLGTLLALSFVFSLLGANRRKKELENFADLVKHGGSISETRLARFGAIGEQMKFILSALSEASDRKSARIASLTGVVREVVELSDKSIFVIGLDGRILTASRPILEAKPFKDLRIGASNFADFFPDLDLRAVLEEADRTHSIVEWQDGLSFLPVYSINREIGHFIVSINHKSLLESIGSLIQKARSSQKQITEDGDAGKRQGFLRAMKGLFRKKSGSTPPKVDEK